MFARTPPTKNLSRLEPINTRAIEKQQALRAKREKGWVSVYTEREIPGIGAAAVCRCAACKTTGRPSLHRDDGSSARAKRAGFRVGDRVLLSGERTGVVRWLGELDSDYTGSDLFAGVQLDDPIGQHNGVYRGKRYFVCPDNHGVFVPQRDVLFVKSRCEIHYKTLGSPPKRAHHVKPLSSTTPVATSAATPADDARDTPGSVSAGPSSYTLERLREAQRRGEEYVRQQRESEQTDQTAAAPTATRGSAPAAQLAAVAPSASSTTAPDPAGASSGAAETADAEELARISELVRQETERIRQSIRSNAP